MKKYILQSILFILAALVFACLCEIISIQADKEDAGRADSIEQLYFSEN